MLDDIIKALRGRRDIQAWTVRHVITRGAQNYAVPSGIESQRAVSSERYIVDVLRETQAADGAPSVGRGNATLLPGDDIAAAVETAAVIASLIHNPPYSFPEPADFPDVPLADTEFQADPLACLARTYAQLKAAADQFPAVRMTASECFGEEKTEHLCNSKGIDVSQVGTHIHAEAVLIAGAGDREVESFLDLNRRRVADLNLDETVGFNARSLVDLLNAGPTPNFSGPVVLRDEALATFMAGDGLLGGVLQQLGSAASKFNKYTTWEIGQSVFRKDVLGDPLTVWANRQLPYGTSAERFDEDGLPAGRVALILDNKLVAFSATQQYAEYLKVPATGKFGIVELPAGHSSAASLLNGKHVEVVRFSWFNPDSITGEFATEIRFGYLVDGDKRVPFRGGLLVGNWIDALGDVRWSAETGFYGNYQGPTTARFNHMKVAGGE
jgi:PmbA protein